MGLERKNPAIPHADAWGYNDAAPNGALMVGAESGFERVLHAHDQSEEKGGEQHVVILAAPGVREHLHF